MFNLLAGVFKSNKTTIRENLVNEFNKDYVKSNNFINRFPVSLQNIVRSNLEETYCAASKNTGTETTLWASQIFSGLRDVYILLWLLETEYGNKLALKQSQLQYIDDYGDLCFDDWYKELNRFVLSKLYIIDSFLKNEIPQNYQVYSKKLNFDSFLFANYQDQDDLCSASEVISFVVESCIDNYFMATENDDEQDGLDSITDPYQYEHAIAKKFTDLGWSARATVGSGDQGADVIAELNGIKLIIQCKLYSSPVGNKAVQEVAAAHKYYDGHLGIVVTNNSFTKSAKQLSESLGVVLIHHSEIEGFLEASGQS